MEASKKGTIIPADPKAGRSVKEHAFFGMARKDRRPVADVMDDLRGARYRNDAAADLVDKAESRFLSEFNFTILPFTENIGHRASIYIEEYSLSQGLRAGDAIFAATATENNIPLASSNAKHFKPIRDLDLRVFKP